MINQNTLKICTHVTMLEKKYATKLLTDYKPNYICKFSSTNSSHQKSQLALCLHCGQEFCGIYSENQCLKKHQENNQNHVFSLSVYNFFLYCKLCNDDLDSMILAYAGDPKGTTYMTTVRFTDYIRNMWLNSNPQIINKIKEQAKNHISFINLGNTCFLNVSLQLLMATQLFKDFYSQGFFEINKKKPYKLLPKQIEYFYDDIIQEKQSNSWNIVGSKAQKKKNQQFRIGIVGYDLNIILQQIATASIHQKISYRPDQLLSKLSKMDSKYAKSQEQDSHELLLILIDSLSQGELHAINYDAERYKQIDKILGHQKISVCHQIFASYLASRLICNQCKKVSWSKDLIYDLTLQISPKQKTRKVGQIQKYPIQIKYYNDLQYPKPEAEIPFLLSQFFSEETLTKHNNYFSCQNCPSVIGKKMFFMLSLPKVLLLTIKRFHNMKKNSDHVQFPQEINLEGVSLQSEPSKYKLYCVVVHQGSSLHSGHYVCYTRQKQQWFYCSDEKIRKVMWKQVRSQQAYILAYQRNQNKLS